MKDEENTKDDEKVKRNRKMRRKIMEDDASEYVENRWLVAMINA